MPVRPGYEIPVVYRRTRRLAPCLASRTHGRFIMLNTSALKGALGQDALASIVVFLVALPLCMGIAIASGVPPALGIITGIVGGLITGVLAGCPLQVSGPAAGLTVIVLELVHQYGVAGLGIIVVLAGLLQMAAGAMSLGRWFQAVSP